MSLNSFNDNEYEQHQNVFTGCFDTPFTLMGYTKSKEEFDQYYNILFDEINYYLKLFDKYNEYDGVNNIMTINKNAGIKPVVVDENIIELLMLAQQWYEITDGYIDITMGSVLTVWHDYREQGMILNSNDQYGLIPSQNELRDSKQYTGWEFIEIDQENMTVYISDEKVSIDVGAIAKGFAVEKASQKLLAKGFEYGVINGGGNVKVVGAKPDDSSWVVGIQEPNSFTQYSLDGIDINTQKAVVSSGDYARYYLALDEFGEQVRLHHIINPFTLMPYDHLRGVSIIIDNSTYGDFLSSYFSLLTIEEGLIKVDELKKLGYNFEVLWVLDESLGEIDKTVSYNVLGETGNQYSIYMTQNLEQLSYNLKK